MDNQDLVSSATLARFIGVVQKVARCVTRQTRGGFDALALDRQDYEQILMARTWAALKRWRSDPRLSCQGRKAEGLYVCASLWAEARVYERKRGRANRQGVTVPLFESEPALADEGFELRMLMRHDLNAASLCVPADYLEAFKKRHIRGDRPMNLPLRKKSRKTRKMLSEILDSGIMP